MAQLDPTPELIAKTLLRAQALLGEEKINNLALDILLDEEREKNRILAEKLIELTQQNQALQERARAAEQANELLREQIDPKRKGRFRGADQGRSD